MEDFSAARTKMVDSQLRTENVTDFEVLAAMAAVPRERFVPAGQGGLAYVDRDVPITPKGAEGGSRYLMEPAPFARLLQAAEVAKTDIVLDVGCGTGYSAAVLARLADSVVALESDAALAASASETLTDLGVANAAVVSGPLEEGYPSEGPFDVIVVEGAVEVVPDALFAQLKDGGRLVAVVGYGRAASARVYRKSAGEIGSYDAFDAAIMPLPGFRKPQAFVF